MKKMKKIDDAFKREFQEKLKTQIREHRIKQDYSQIGVANAVETTLNNYQRWESTGQYLTNIFRLLKVFRELRFSTIEIIDVLGLPPLTLNEIKAICQDEDTLKSIKEHSVYSIMRKECFDMDDYTLEMLLKFFLEERLKRFERRRENP